MIKLDTSENRAKLIYLGIGSNLGNRKNNIDKAKFKLSENNILILRESNIYETFSWPNKKNPNGPSLYCAVIVKKVDEKTRSKTSINDLLRD